MATALDHSLQTVNPWVHTTGSSLPWGKIPKTKESEVLPGWEPAATQQGGNLGPGLPSRCRAAITHPEELQWGQQDPGNVQCHVAMTQNQCCLTAQVRL